MALYRSPGVAEDKALPRALAAQLGMQQLDANWLADEDGISQHRRVATRDADGRGGFIPYTDRAIRWHTDGYYHPAERRIRGMVLHCVRPAASGGVNGLLDHELAYIALRDADPAHVRALMQPDAMTIPARADDDGVARPAQSRPGLRGRRTTAACTCATRRARAASSGRPTPPPAPPWRRWRRCSPASRPGSCAPGWSPAWAWSAHNVLHDRTGFEDDPARPRLLYRARYLDRVALPAAPGADRAAMAQWVTVWRAAQLVGVPRGTLQQRVRAGELELADGLVSTESLMQLYPQTQLESSGMLERVAQIRDESFGRRLRERLLPSQEVLAQRLFRQSQELADVQRHLQRYHALVIALRERLRQLRPRRAATIPGCSNCNAS